MTFRSDDRGVTVQVGAILLFAMLVVAMSLYQATVIPSQNAKVEFRHDERVQSQMQDVRNAILRTAATGSGQPTSVTLGTQYPGHVLFVNPPPASGTLRTRESGTVDIENLKATDPETADYFDASEHSFSTRSLVYVPDYNQYGNAPDTVYESSVVYNRGRDGNATLTGQQLVQGKRITLVTLDGNLSRAQSGTVSLDPQALSPSTVTRSISVQSNGSDPVIRVPTALSEEKWNRLLAEQKANGYVESVSVEDGILELTLRGDEDGTPVTYDLRMAKVGVGSGTKATSEEYITNVSGGGNVVSGGTTTLVAEVRDRYNNPVSGVVVNASGGTVAGSHRTDDQGRVRFEYDATAPGDETVTLSIDDDSAARERVEFPIHAVAGGTGGGSGGGSYDVEWVASNGLDCTPSLDECTLDRSERSSVTLTANVTYDDQPVTGTNVDFGLNRTGILSTSPTSATTDSNGEVRTTVEASSTGDVRLLAASGGDADPVVVHVVRTDGIPGRFVYGNDAIAVDGPDDGDTKGGVEFSLRNGFAQSATITNVEIDPADTGIDVIADRSGDDGSVGHSEVVVETDHDSGYVDFSDLYFPTARDGTYLRNFYDLDDDGRVHGHNPVVSSDGTATFSLYELFRGSYRNGYRNVDMVGKQVTVTVDYRLENGTTGEKRVTFVPSGNNGGDGNGDDDARTPRIGMRVDDLSHVDQDRVRFTTSYDVTRTNSSFERVQVVTDDFQRGNDAKGTNTSTSKRGSAAYRLSYGSDERWRMTVQVIYEHADGTEYVAAERSITDEADSLDPDGNDDLSTADSATIDSYSVDDRTKYGQPRYTLDYDLSSGSDFTRVSGAAISRENGDAVYDSSTDRHGSFRLDGGYGGGTKFTIKLLVYDSNGVIVDSVERSDTAG